MQQRTSKLLYNYWNTVRDGRIAPQRFEIEPARIAALLPETFIMECADLSDYRIRLAGTRICDQMGREMRGTALLDFWKPDDREALANLLHNVLCDGAVAVARFSARRDEGHGADFEMTLMPLIHTGQSVNRILGSITAINPPFWLGTALLDFYDLDAIELIWPDGAPRFIREHASEVGQPAVGLPNENPRIAGDNRRRFRVYEGGLSDPSG